jgi:hypothetical protein
MRMIIWSMRLAANSTCENAAGVEELLNMAPPSLDTIGNTSSSSGSRRKPSLITLQTSAATKAQSRYACLTYTAYVYMRFCAVLSTV